MTAPTLWKWRVALLDDNPHYVGLRETVILLEQLDVDVLVYGGEHSTPPRLDFLCDPVASSNLASCHVLFIDMQWDKPGVDGGAVKLPNLHDPDASLSDKLKTFVRGINQLYKEKDCFPNNLISAKYRGFWVAAALSHLCPHSLICFFSGFAEILNGPIAGAFSQFLHSEIHVIHKNSTTGIEKKDFFNRIAQLQRTVFERSSEAFEWLVGKVLLPSLMGRQPLDGVTGKLWGGDKANAEWRLNTEFFPQWKDWKNEDGGCVKGLLQFVSKPAFRLSQPSERALKSIKHDLTTIMLETSPDVHSLERPIQTCFDVGSAAEGILMLIKQAQASGSRASLERALELCDSIRENSLRQLDDLCVKYGGQFTCAQQLETKPAPSPHYDDDYRLPFDLSHLRRVIEALTINAETPSIAKPNVRLVSTWDGKCLSVEYVDGSSAGFDSFDTPLASSANVVNANDGEQRIFVEKVITSIKEKGLNRGLPLALTFPFMYPIRKLECLVTDRWIELFPQPRVYGASSSDWKFGMRWSFHMPQPTGTREARM